METPCHAQSGDEWSGRAGHAFMVMAKWRLAVDRGAAAIQEMQANQGLQNVDGRAKLELLNSLENLDDKLYDLLNDKEACIKWHVTTADVQITSSSLATTYPEAQMPGVTPKSKLIEFVYKVLDMKGA